MRVFLLIAKCGNARRAAALLRGGFTAIVIASFFWISFVTQTHIHAQSPVAGAAQAAEKSDAKHGVHLRKKPAKEEQDDCPLCQAVSHSGTFTTPLIAVLSALTIFFLVELPQLRNWHRADVSSRQRRSRGPPRG